jgi:hypothetical protein
VWENQRWKALPSRVDRAGRTVTAALPHASWIGVGVAKGALTVGVGVTRLSLLGLLTAFGVENATTRSALFAAWYGRSYEHETPEGNFKVHYYRHGASKIPTDTELLGDPFVESPPGLAPLYVRRVGSRLESARSGLEADGFPLPPARLIRYDAFLVPCGDNGKAYGESLLGGPLFISNKLAQAAAEDRVDLDELMAGTAVHELLHVAQGRYYGTIRSELMSSLEPFVEAATQYNTWRYSHTRGSSLVYHENKYTKAHGSLPTVPIDGTEDPWWYAYSMFFEWMHLKYGESEAREVIRRTHWGKDGSLASLQAAVTEELKKSSLAEAFVEFARDFYHNDLWSGRLVPALHYERPAYAATSDHHSEAFGQPASEPGRRFRILVNRSQDGAVVRHPYAELSATSIPHLSAHAVYVHAHPPQRGKRACKAKLVLEADAGRASGRNLTVSVAAGRLAGGGFGGIPGKGDPGTFQDLGTAGKRMVIDDIGGKKGPSLVTILAVNSSLTEAAGGLVLRRWLLEPPRYVAMEYTAEGVRRGRSGVLLRWEPVDLQAQGQVFEGYQLYRGLSNEPLDSYQLIHRLPMAAGGTDEITFEPDAPPADGDYRYAVSTVDRFGNESHLMQADLVDPWIGTWDGEVALVEGSFAEPIITAIESWRLHDEDRPTPPPPALAEVYKLIRQLEQIAKLGVPVQFQIVRRADHYQLRATEVMWYPLEEENSPPTAMVRHGRTALRPKGAHPEVNRPLLRLHRYDPDGEKPNVIREDGYTFEAKEGSKQRCTVRWVFERAKPPDQEAAAG